MTRSIETIAGCACATATLGWTNYACYRVTFHEQSAVRSERVFLASVAIVRYIFRSFALVPFAAFAGVLHGSCYERSSTSFYATRFGGSFAMSTEDILSCSSAGSCFVHCLHLLLPLHILIMRLRFWSRLGIPRFHLL
jgi:hypothetical protein